MTHLNISIHYKAECFNHALFRSEPCSFRLQFTYFTLSLCLFYLSPALISRWPAGQHNYLPHSVLFPHTQTYIDTATMSHIAPILLLSFLMHLWGTSTRPLTPAHAQINTYHKYLNFRLDFLSGPCKCYSLSGGTFVMGHIYGGSKESMFHFNTVEQQGTLYH